jgi:1,2-phenylacetyl-CoA epoxidase catalytic subunit
MSSYALVAKNARERRAIAALRELEKIWPDTLMMFAWADRLIVLREDEYRPGEIRMNDVPMIEFPGIRIDGGDP